MILREKVNNVPSSDTRQTFSKYGASNISYNVIPDGWMNAEILFAIAIALRREEEKAEKEVDRSAYSLLASVRVWRSLKYYLKATCVFENSPSLFAKNFPRNIISINQRASCVTKSHPLDICKYLPRYNCDRKDNSCPYSIL